MDPRYDHERHTGVMYEAREYVCIAQLRAISVHMRVQDKRVMLVIINMCGETSFGHVEIEQVSSTGHVVERGDVEVLVG